MHKIVLATGNAGKLAELRAMLDGTDIELVPQAQLGIGDAEETGSTFIENAILKARHASRASDLPALADDSGLCVDALQGAPGLYSARYAGVHGDNAANNAKLLHELEGLPGDRRGAHFVCVLALLRGPADPDPLLAHGRWYGRVLAAPRGTRGFGYDPVFLPDDADGASAAELDPAVKNRISHRGQALAVLRDWLLPSPSGSGCPTTADWIGRERRQPARRASARDGASKGG